jgi:hypothetical protein
MASRHHRHKTDIAPLHCRASAQTIIPRGGSPLLNAPLPPPLPEPMIAPPVVAKMDAPLQQNYAPLSTRPSFIRDPAPTDKHLNSQFLN